MLEELNHTIESIIKKNQHILDCGCGDAWNPIDVYSKSLWFCVTGERIPGLGASLFRNLISLSLLFWSYRNAKVSTTEPEQSLQTIGSP